MYAGESLINDGSAVLLFQFFFFLLQGVMETPFSTFLMFVKLLFVGPAFGVAVGFLGYFWLLFFRRHPLTQCLAYITFCYISYFLAEAVFSLSGPLTAVCYGLFIKAYGHIALDRDAQTKHHTFVAGMLFKRNVTICFNLFYALLLYIPIYIYIYLLSFSRCSYRSLSLSLSLYIYIYILYNLYLYI